jgi:hypothetical protein
MERVPAELALLALRQSGQQVSPSTLRMWVRRGHITRGPGGYDLGEILAYLDRRAAPHHLIDRSRTNAPPRPGDFSIMRWCASTPTADTHRLTDCQFDDTTSPSASAAVGAPHFAKPDDFGS